MTVWIIFDSVMETIVCGFSSLEKAKKYVDVMNDFDYEIVELKLDPNFLEN